MLDKNDWFGVTITGGETKEKRHDLSVQLIQAKAIYGISTWVSFEPVIDTDIVLDCLRYGAKAVDKVKIGKLNYHNSDINCMISALKLRRYAKNKA